MDFCLPEEHIQDNVLPSSYCHRRGVVKVLDTVLGKVLDKVLDMDDLLLLDWINDSQAAVVTRVVMTDDTIVDIGNDAMNLFCMTPMTLC